MSGLKWPKKPNFAVQSVQGEGVLLGETDKTTKLKKSSKILKKGVDKRGER